MQVKLVTEMYVAWQMSVWLVSDSYSRASIRSNADYYAILSSFLFCINIVHGLGFMVRVRVGVRLLTSHV